MATHQSRTDPRHRTRSFSGRNARQGDIILNTPLRRAIFVLGLAGVVVVAFLLTYWIG